jgi:hypothetical protein
MVAAAVAVPHAAAAEPHDRLAPPEDHQPLHREVTSLSPDSFLLAQTNSSPQNSIFIAISISLLRLMIFCFRWTRTKCMLSCANLTRSLTHACGDLIGLAKLMVQQNSTSHQHMWTILGPLRKTLDWSPTSISGGVCLYSFFLLLFFLSYNWSDQLRILES